MKKRILTMLTVLTALLLFGEISANAEIIDSGECGNNVTYTLDDEGTLMISGTGDMGYFFGWGAPWQENEDKVKEVIIEEGVTSTGTCAFENCINLKKVTLADTIESIEASSFYGCSSLEEISLPQNLVTIELQAFSDCTSLKEISIPDSVTEIGSWAFSGCTNLEYVNIGRGLVQAMWGYRRGTFADCPNIKTVSVSESNENYTSIDGILYDKQITTLLKYPEGKTDTVYTVPDSVTSINEIFCDYLEIIEISKNVSVLDRFHEIIKGNALKEINVAEENTNFTSVDSVLFDKEMTTLIQYPSGKQDYEYSIPESVTDISYNAFINTVALEKVVIPKSVSTGLWFTGCTGLTDISVSPENQAYCSLNGTLFDKDKSRLICYPSAKPYDFYSIPEGVTDIDGFENCKYLKAVTIPSSVKGIYTFNNCTALEAISIPKNVVLVNYNSFENVNVKDVYYEGSEDEWKRIEMRESRWFKNANIHYNSVLEPKLQPIPITTIAVTKTDTETEWQFEVEVGETYSNSYVYAVIYDEYDNIVTIECIPLETEGGTTVTVPRSANDKTAKIFVWTNKMQPITEAESVDL